MVNERATRKYQLRKRAVAIEDTRQRITEATVALHGSVGPARTTVSAIAERAGVQRHTVYRHFPTEDALFAACQSHYWATHPWPDVAAWERIADPRERLVVALGELYAFYASVEPMMTNVLRDADQLEVVRQAVRSYDDTADSIAGQLGGAIGAGRPLTVAAVRHAVDFRTWQCLVGLCGVEPADAIKLMAAMVESSV
jgi:AcrR family transcriptional regulator